MNRSHKIVRTYPGASLASEDRVIQVRVAASVDRVHRAVDDEVHR